MLVEINSYSRLRNIDAVFMPLKLIFPELRSIIRLLSTCYIAIYYVREAALVSSAVSLALPSIALVLLLSLELSGYCTCCPVNGTVNGHVKIRFRIPYKNVLPAGQSELNYASLILAAFRAVFVRKPHSYLA
jgi:hypothetical protein